MKKDVFAHFQTIFVLCRLSLSFFALSGLDVLGNLNLIEKHKEEFINWIYLFQITPDAEENSIHRCGFRGSLAATAVLGNKVDVDYGFGKGKFVGSSSSHSLDTSHITMTYAAINCLLILGDDFERLNKRSILAGIKALQLENGRYHCLQLAHSTMSYHQPCFTLF